MIEVREGMRFERGSSYVEVTMVQTRLDGGEVDVYYVTGKKSRTAHCASLSSFEAVVGRMVEVKDHG